MISLKKYLTDYRKYLRKTLDSSEEIDYRELLKQHESHICFFRHERMIHLIVLFLISLVMIGSITAAVILKSFSVTLLAILLICLEVPYITHYYFLENQVQRLYLDFDEIFSRINPSLSFLSERDKL